MKRLALALALLPKILLADDPPPDERLLGWTHLPWQQAALIIGGLVLFGFIAIFVPLFRARR